MSFETTMKFMIDACTELSKDTIKTPSASLVLGNNIKVGSGFFDIRQEYKQT